MPIFDQGYSHWDGQTSGMAWRWWAIARRGAQTAAKNRWIRILLFLAITPAIVLASLLALWGLIEQQASWAEAFLRIFGLPETIFSDKARLRNVVWTLAFHYFIGFVFFFAMVLVLLVGPNLISQDLRFNALPLYLSKPVRRIDYFLGKLGVIGVLLALILGGPAVFAYLLGVSFSLDVAVVRDTIRVLSGTLVFGLVVVLSAGTLMLAISSLSRNSRTVGAIWLGLIMLSGTFGNALAEGTRKPQYKLISYTDNLLRLEREFLRLDVAAKQMLELEKDVAAQAEAMAKKTQVGPLGLLPPFKRDMIKRATNSGPRQTMRDRQGRRFGPMGEFERFADEDVPASHAALVLLGLFVGSAALLASRVRSLDRLK